MMASLFEMMVYIIVNLLVVKMVFFRKQQGDDSKTESVSWKSAVDSMSIMETRLHQLQERDVKQQERLWFLEDQNRDLTQRVARLTKELLLVTCEVGDEGIEAVVAATSDDDDDLHSIPPNN